MKCISSEYLKSTRRIPYEYGEREASSKGDKFRNDGGLKCVSDWDGIEYGMVCWYRYSVGDGIVSNGDGIPP